MLEHFSDDATAPLDGASTTPIVSDF